MSAKDEELTEAPAEEPEVEETPFVEPQARTLKRLAEAQDS